MRHPHPADGRAITIAITPAGAALANRAVVDVERVDREYFGALGDGGAALTEGLRRLDALDAR